MILASEDFIFYPKYFPYSGKHGKGKEVPLDAKIGTNIPISCISCKFHHCTMRPFHCKNGVRYSIQISTTASIFLLYDYFRQKYLENASCAISLLYNIWVLVEHSLLQQLNFQNLNCGSSSLKPGCE